MKEVTKWSPIDVRRGFAYLSCNEERTESDNFHDPTNLLPNQILRPVAASLLSQLNLQTCAEDR